jgi:hypothetical protein
MHKSDDTALIEFAHKALPNESCEIIRTKYMNDAHLMRFTMRYLPKEVIRNLFDIPFIKKKMDEITGNFTSTRKRVLARSYWCSVLCAIIYSYCTVFIYSKNMHTVTTEFLICKDEQPLNRYEQFNSIVVMHGFVKKVYSSVQVISDVYKYILRKRAIIKYLHKSKMMNVMNELSFGTNIGFGYTNARDHYESIN